jgi:hypothetical protein
MACEQWHPSRVLAEVPPLAQALALVLLQCSCVQTPVGQPGSSSFANHAPFLHSFP